VYPMLPVSLDCVVVFSFVLCTLCCQFLWIVLWFFPSYCVPYVASFSGLSLFFPSYCVPYVVGFSGLCCGFFLRIVYPMLSVSLDCLCFFLRIVYPMLPVSLDCVVVFSFVLCTLCCQFLWIVLWFFPSYCVPYVVSFSGLSLFFPSYCVPYVSVNNIYWIFVRKLLCCQFLWIVFVFFLRIVYPMLPVSLECLCFIALTLLSNVHLKMLKLSSLHVYILRI
jgi:hypothetical protein